MYLIEKILQLIGELDYFVLEQLHVLAINTREWMTTLMKIISLIGDKGFIIFLLSLVLMLIPKTRWTGVCIFGAVCCGTILGNGFLKYIINRARPFASTYTEIYDWWQLVGAPMKTSSSFPSGHVMAVAAGMYAIYLIHRRKLYIFLLFSLSLLMGISRCYLMVHYFSDVIGGIVLGIISATISYKITEILKSKKEILYEWKELIKKKQMQ